MKALLMMTAAALCLSACAKSTDELGKAYVSPMMYEDYSCKQLKGEMMRLGRRAEELTQSVNANAEGDSMAMGVGLILFWPSLFFIDGDTPEAQEYRQIKGEYDAVEKTAIMNGCAGVPDSNPFAEAEKAYNAKDKRQPSDYPSERQR